MFRKTLFLTASLYLCTVFVIAQPDRDVDLLLYNGKIFSADGKGTIHQAIAIKGERIFAVGNTGQLREKFDAKKEIDLKGKLVTPGFNDAHIHFVGVGLALLRVDLNGSKTVNEARARIAAKIKELPKGAWVLGRGWDHTLWGNKLPTRKDLDDISSDNPVFVQRVDGHIAWGNSLAFKLAGITKATKAPEGGEIVLDKNGEPEGVLKETAQGLVDDVRPQTTAAEVLKGIELALEEAKKFGLTSVQGGADYSAIPLYKQILEDNKLTARVAVWQDFETPVETLVKQRNDFAVLRLDPNRLKLGVLKGYMDGSLGSQTAAMIAPYSDDPKNSGIPRRPADEMIRMIVERDKAGFQIGLHAIGDLGNRIALDGFQSGIMSNAVKSAMSRTGTPPTFPSYPDKRHRIEHSQVVAPYDFLRFRDLGIIASMQPTHAITDKRWAPDRLGEYRSLGAYSWHTFKSYGVHVAFGTDSPVEPLNTYLTLYAAVSRQSEDGEPAGGWQPQEKLSIEDAIRAYTYESAYAEFAENKKGTIDVGKLADLVVHSKDLLTIPHKDILETRPVYTIFNGKIVYEN